MKACAKGVARPFPRGRGLPNFGVGSGRKITILGPGIKGRKPRGYVLLLVKRILLRLKRLVVRLIGTLPPPAAPVRAALTFEKFEHRAPTHQNAADLFKGKWASKLGDVSDVAESGQISLFVSRIGVDVAQHLGTGGRFDGMSILELGPLEGAQTYQLDQLGAHTVAIEANAEAFLKCLVVKEVLNLRNSRFLLGDFVEYLAHSKDRFDLVFACGVLYHMQDPVNLIRLIAGVTDRCFVWTHYYDEAHRGSTLEMVAKPVTVHGLQTTYYQFNYPNMDYDLFYGGNKPVTSWMPRDSILDAFKHFGFGDITIISEQPDHPHGSCFGFVAQRRR